MVPVAAQSSSVALQFLFQRLNWPVPMVRWQAAKEIRNLLNSLSTRGAATHELLEFLERCETESEACAVLNIVLLTAPEGRPTRLALTSRLRRPSILSDAILDRTFGKTGAASNWRTAHSGPAPDDFEGGSYFEEHKGAHVPPILGTNLRRLQRGSGFPFMRQWAFEWSSLCKNLGIRYTRYPHYFDDVSDARAGIMGQYWQRQRDAFQSAYLRTLAFAVSEWGLPERVAVDYCLEIVTGLAGLFEIEPGARPDWLSDFPERFYRPGADLESLVRELTSTAHPDGMRLVSLDTPVAQSEAKYAKLTLTAHLVTADYQMVEGAYLYERMRWLLLGDTLAVEGPPAEITVEEAAVEGQRGQEVSVCNCLFPMPFGTWQGDFFGMGIPILAPYVLGETEIRCSDKGVDLLDKSGALASSTRFWNDNWVPPQPKGGSTRCAVSATARASALADAEAHLGMKLAWFARVRVWDREKDYGEYAETERNVFLFD